MPLSVEADETVWSSTNIFAASMNAALYCGAEVDFVDLDLQTYKLSVSVLEEKLETAEVSGVLHEILVP